MNYIMNVSLYSKQAWRRPFGNMFSRQQFHKQMPNIAEIQRGDALEGSLPKPEEFQVLDECAQHEYPHAKTNDIVSVFERINECIASAN